MSGDTRALQRRVSAFCETRIAPLAEAKLVAAISAYLIGLVLFRCPPPTIRGRWNWGEVEAECFAELPFSTSIRRNLHPALELIKQSAKSHNTAGTKHSSKNALPAKGSNGLRKRKKPQSALSIAPPTVYPEPKFELDYDPAKFHEALQVQMERHGDTAWGLHKAVVGVDETFDRKTLYNWLNESKAPRSVASLEVLARIERRYQLPENYFRRKLPHPMRAATGHQPGIEIGPAERRRLAWHLPDDFNFLPPAKQKEIVEWVRRVVISGATDYRRYQANTSRHRFSIRFPFSTVDVVRGEIDDGEACQKSETDGRMDAPHRLAEEMAELVRFKTATLTAIGFRRNKVWGAETTAQKIEHFGLLFGALAASPSGNIRGRGIPIEKLTFGLLLFPGVWDWYVQWRERRRGFYTVWELNMLSSGLELTRYETGWLRQNPQLLDGVSPVAGMVSLSEIDTARGDWNAACDTLHRHAINRVREIQRVARVHRDPFEPIMPVLEAKSPLAEYKKITDEILARMPDESRYPVPAAEAVRSFLILRFGLHLGLRQKNLRQLLVCPRGHHSRTERHLQDLECGELRWSDKDNGWEVLIPAKAFKNSGSSFFGSKPFRLILPRTPDFYELIDAYLDRHRERLLGRAGDPGTFFVKTAKQKSKTAAYSQVTFYEAWRLTTARYGVYNPYTGRGAIQGLLPHGPHNVRDVLATHVLKVTGSYEQASYAIQDTPEMVRKHYGRFLPEDKAALAARILNQVWEVDDMQGSHQG